MWRSSNGEETTLKPSESVTTHTNILSNRQTEETPTHFKPARSMTIPLTIILCTLTGSIIADTPTFRGHVGGDVQVRCSHSNAHSNVKYFCKSPCSTEEDILIKSTRKLNPNTKGRFSLHDRGSGVFIVTISNLRKSDSGTYWCTVERWVQDTYYEVVLKVLDAPKPTSRPTTSPVRSTSNTTEAREITDSKTSSTTTRPVTAAADTSDNKQIIYIGAGLAALVLLFGVFLFILIKQSKQKKAKKQEPVKAQLSWNPHIHHHPHMENVPKYSSGKMSSANQMTPSIQNTTKASRRPQPDPNSAIYSNITSDSHNSLSFAAVNFTDQSDHLNYSSVIFIRESDSNTSNTNISQVETSESSSVLYSTINPTNSSHTDEDTSTVIYATIKKAK